MPVPESSDRTRLEAWERRSEVPLLLLALAFLLAYAWPILDRDPADGLRLVLWTVWGAFAAEFAIRLWLARGQRLAYARRHWYDVAMVALPLLRGLRLLRLLTLIRFLDRTGVRAAAGRVGVYVGVTSVLFVFLGALAVLDAESSNAEANLTTYGDALWWAAVTTSSVGYGDFYPVTAEGRFIAVGLMVVNIGLIGSATGIVVSFLTSRFKGSTDDTTTVDE